MIRWLVVGAGLAGREHLLAIEHVHGAELAGVVTPNPRAVTSAPIFPTIGDALSECQADAAIIATPHHTHYAVAGELIAARLPVLCEKPVGRNALDAASIHELAYRSGVPVGVVLNQRATAHNRWIKSLISSGGFVVHSISFRGILSRLGGWRADKQFSGGGVLRTIGVHYLDLLCWWLDSTPKHLDSELSGGETESAVSIVATFHNGVRGSLYLTALCESGKRAPLECHIEGEEAKVEMANQTIIHSEGLPEPPPAEAVIPGAVFGPGHFTVVAEATAALAAGKPFPVTLAQALPTLQLVDDAYRLAG